jgi:hypothetical protein
VEHVRRLRLAQQLLDRRTRGSPADLVRKLGGVQAQVRSAASLALRARSKHVTEGSIAEARTDDRSILWTWAMRGTLHLIAAEDATWLVPLTTQPRISNAYRRLAQEGLPAHRVDDALDRVAHILGRDGPMTRAELAERLQRAGIRTEGQAMAHLLWLACARGRCCRGPDRGPETCFVRVEDWLSTAGPWDREDRDGAFAELAVRFLGAHGPSEPADLATWSGLGTRDAARAWRSVEDRLSELETPKGPRWMLRSARAPAPAGIVRLIPAFDEYLLGWKDRSFEVDPALVPRINRGGGWIHPVVLADGRAVATWQLDRGDDPARLLVRPFSTIAPAVRRALDSEARDVGRFLDTSVAIVVERD